ncbi:MAG: ATP-dependent zinc protease [Rickettsiales bacterium]
MLTKESLLVGWREWASLPMLNTPLIKVKIDTGAKTSALHAYDLEILEMSNKKYAKFVIHPLQKNESITRCAIAEVIDSRVVRSSNGHKEERVVIRSPIKIGNHYWDIDITLTKRDIMRYRMLLGREAMKSLRVNPGRSYCQGKVPSKKARLEYGNNYA